MNSLSECRKTCWMIAGIVGLLVLIILWWLAGFGFFGALLWALIIGVLVGFVLPFFRCQEDEEAITATSSDAMGGTALTGNSADQERQRAEAAVEERRAAEEDAARQAQEEASRRAAEQEATRQAEASTAVSQRKAETAAGDFDHDGVVEGTDEGARPAALSGPRGGVADDLKKIKGVGPKLEGVLNELGFFHFDQVAGWSADEVAWVDANLGGISERVHRDGWVEQARLLASGGETEFSKKVDRGDVY